VFEVLPSSEGFTVQTVSEDGTGGLWVGYNGERIDHWANGELTQYTRLQTNLLLAAPLYVRSLFLDRDRLLWAGVLHHGLLQFKAGAFQPAPGAEALPKDVLAIYQDRTNRIWVGTQEGLALWDGHDWSQPTNGLSPALSARFAEDPDGNLWIGTEGGGLTRLSAGRSTCFTKTNGLPSNNVRSLLFDDTGVLWVGTSSGLARSATGVGVRMRVAWAMRAAGSATSSKTAAVTSGWARPPACSAPAKADLNQLADSLESVLIRSFGKTDGLPSGECSQGSQPAACRSTDGKLWFPTIRGLVSVDPSLITVNSNPRRSLSRRS